jgi:hypothetical protein
MNVDLPAEIACLTRTAPLPQCARLDACAGWAYARQADDETWARRIRDRAVRCCGELLRYPSAVFASGHLPMRSRRTYRHHSFRSLCVGTLLIGPKLSRPRCSPSWVGTKRQRSPAQSSRPWKKKKKKTLPVEPLSPTNSLRLSMHRPRRDALHNMEVKMPRQHRPPNGRNRRGGRREGAGRRSHSV